jgi:hypothetical protein
VVAELAWGGLQRRAVTAALLRSIARLTVAAAACSRSRSREMKIYLLFFTWRRRLVDRSDVRFRYVKASYKLKKSYQLF